MTESERPEPSPEASAPEWSTPSGGDPPGPPRRQVAVVTALGGVVLVVVAATAALLINRDQGPLAAAPPSESAVEDPTETPPVSPSPTTAPEPTEEQTESAAPADRAAGLRRITREVSAIRELPQKRRLRAEALSRRALADKISEVAARDADPAQTRATERLLVALRLAPPGFDLAAVLDELLRAQVKGFYVPEDRTLYIPRSRGAATPGEQRTAAHEITHALQDQSFGVAKIQQRAGDNSDTGLAVLSVIEGDASLTEELWSLEHQSTAERQAAASESTGDPGVTANAPDYLLSNLFFPYSEGARFVVGLYQSGGFAAVDEALQNPPTSTEQILHPEKYRAGEEPENIRVRETPGEGWRELAAYDFGEFDLRELMEALGDTAVDQVGTGWAGGQIKTWERGEDMSVGLALRFDTRGDAEEACRALPQWYATVADGEPQGGGRYAGDRDHLAVECRGRRVFFGLADNADTAASLVP